MTTEVRMELLVDRLPGEQVIVHQVNLVRPDPANSEQVLRETLICQMLNVGDENVKVKLQELGWTPPGVESPLSLAAKAVVQARPGAGGIPNVLHNAIAALAEFVK